MLSMEYDSCFLSAEDCDLLCVEAFLTSRAAEFPRVGMLVVNVLGPRSLGLIARSAYFT